MIGATRPGGGLAMHYFDTRAVHRVYDMSAKFSADGNFHHCGVAAGGSGGKQMERDFGLTYSRE